jgi:hypothetical protein
MSNYVFKHLYTKGETNFAFLRDHASSTISFKDHIVLFLLETIYVDDDVPLCIFHW